MANKLISWGFGPVSPVPSERFSGKLCSHSSGGRAAQQPQLHAVPGQCWEQGQKEQAKGQHVREANKQLGALKSAMCRYC